MYSFVAGNPFRYTDPRGLNPVAGPIQGAEIGAAILPGWGPVIGAEIGAIGGYLFADRFDHLVFAKPPANAYDPNGPKAPGKPGDAEGFGEPKGGDDWVRNPNGHGDGWRVRDGGVWVPTGPDSGSTGDAHGGPHWDVQYPGGGYENVYPGGLHR